MNFSSKFSEILWDLALQLPLIITLLACMVVMIVRWKRHAAVSALALTGLLLLLLHIPVFMIIYASALQMLPSYPTSDDYQRLFLIIGLIFNVTLLVAYVPLLLAIFIKRRA